MSRDVDVKENVNRKYLDEDKMVELNVKNLNNYEFVSNDTINEEVLLKVIKDTGKVEELFALTLQFAIIGYGNRQFGQYKYKGEVREMRTIFNDLDIKKDNDLGSKLSETDLTPRRLLRMFRFQIRKYLNKNPDVCSYLFQKYSNNDYNYREVCFPGAEFLVNQDEARYLYECYKKLDRSLVNRNMTHGLTSRIKRILLAKNITITRDWDETNLFD